MRTDSRGSTLIELLVSISILTIIVGSFYAFTAFLHRDYINQGAFAESLQESRVATSFFQNEIQNAGRDTKGTVFKDKLYNNKVSSGCPTPIIAEPIMEASETTFHFMADQNDDIRYEWVGKEGRDHCKRMRKPSPYTLRRDNGGHLQEVASGIESFQLSYYDENGVRLRSGFLSSADRKKIRKVVLTLRPITKNKSEGKKSEWVSEIYLKNIG